MSYQAKERAGKGVDVEVCGGKGGSDTDNERGIWDGGILKGASHKRGYLIFSRAIRRQGIDGTTRITVVIGLYPLPCIDTSAREFPSPIYGQVTKSRAIHLLLKHVQYHVKSLREPLILHQNLYFATSCVILFTIF